MRLLLCQAPEWELSAPTCCGPQTGLCCSFGFIELPTRLKYPSGWIRAFSSAGPGTWALVRSQKTACYFKLSHQFLGLWRPSHAVTLGYLPFGSLESSLLPAFSTLRSISALMLCPWVSRGGHFCPVKSILPSPRLCWGRPSYFGALLLPCLLRCFGGLISALLPCPTLSLAPRVEAPRTSGKLSPLLLSPLVWDNLPRMLV